jgi:CRISPR-associated protein Cas1
MSDQTPGLIKADLQALPTIRDRITFLYTEHCLISRQDGAITFTDERGTVSIPAAGLSVLMLGPGTNLSHRAVELIGDSGTSIIWVGEHGVRYYAHGRPLTHFSRLLIKQAELVSNVRSRAAVVRSMYEMRFPNEEISGLTIQQLRGREGSRIRDVYRKCSKETGVPWNGREYDPDDFTASDAVNQALSAAHACLYGVCHAVIVALGLSPGLGFVHTGHERSFVYDIADLYKAEITIPIAFQIAKDFSDEKANEIEAVTRHKVRDSLSDGKILERAVKDIHAILENTPTEEEPTTEILHLWDDKIGEISAGKNYSRPERENEENGDTEELNNGQFADQKSGGKGYGKILEDLE